jgi:pimeloyl-ACP methyl ester carboxylesterase
VADPQLMFPAPAAARVIAEPRAPRAGAASVVDLRFASGYRPFHAGYAEEHAAFAVNLTAHARLFRGGAGPRPVVLCLHGWAGGPYWIEERAFVVPYLVRLGVDVALLQLPFHGLRAPRELRRTSAQFFRVNVVRVNEAIGQAVHDARALIAHLRAQGATSIGVIGMSLGAYVTALLAALHDELAFAVAMIPMVDMAALQWHHSDGEPRRRAEAAGLSRELFADVYRAHSPLVRPARVARERLMVVAGRHDGITPPAQAEMLWEHWGRPELYWFPGGHLAQVGRGDAFKAIGRHMARVGAVAEPPARPRARGTSLSRVLGEARRS